MSAVADIPPVDTPAENSKPLRNNIAVRILGAVPPVIWMVIALVFLWEIICRIAQVPAFVLPAPSAIAEVFGSYWHRLLPNALVTLSEVLTGFACAVAIGIPLAVLIAYSSIMERTIYPLIAASQTVPKVAIAPLLLTWFGYGMTPKVVIVVLLSFFPVVINTVMGLKSVSREMIYLSRSMGASGWQSFWKFRLPHSLPSIFGGLKLATVMSVIGAIVGEFIGADSGLGYIIVVAGASFDIARQFAAVILISLIGIVFFAVLEQVERVMIPWRARSRMEAGG